MRWAALGLALAVAGCASPDPTYYALLPLPGTAAAVPFRTIEVRRPGLAGYLDRSSIVLAQQGYRLQLNETLRWSEPLGDMIGRVLAADLSQRLPGSSVFSEAGAITADPDARVEVDVRRFDADSGGPVTLVVEVAIERGRSHLPLAAMPVVLTAPPAGPGAGALAAAMSGLLGQLADRVAAALRGSAAG